MSPHCSWCTSPMRAAAEEKIAAGVPVAEVCRDYGLSRDQWKHHRGHGSLPRLRVEILNDGGGPGTVIPRLEGLIIEVQRERDSSTGPVMVSLLRLERDLLNDVAKLRGEVPQKQSMQVGDWEEWRLVIDALTPFPKAMHAVSLALTDGGEG
jgi:hypothetical protein